MVTTSLLFVLVLACAFYGISTANDPTTLNFAFMTATEGEFTSEEAIPAVELAVENINNDSTILPGYELQFGRVLDTSCEAPKALRMFLDEVTVRRPPPLAVVGCGCSEATKEIAEMIYHWNIPLLSYASWSAELTDSSRYRSHYQLHPDDRHLATALVELLKYYEWQQLLIISQEEEYFLTMETNVKQAMNSKSNNISLLDPVYLNGNESKHQLGDIFPEDIRIFFINTNSTLAASVLCEAFEQGMLFPNYVWLTHGWYRENWWNETECARANVQQLLQGVLTVWLHPGNGQRYTSSQCDGNSIASINIASHLRPHQSSHIASLAYDAVWAMALALNNTVSLTDIAATGCSDVDGEMVSLSDFTHDNEKMGCLFNWSLSNLSFCGLSGEVRFVHGSRVQPHVWILQYRASNVSGESKRVAVASIDFSNSSLPVFSYMVGENDTTVFTGAVPPDGTPVKRINIQPLWFVSIYYIISTAGIVFSVVCLVFGIVYKNRRIVRLTTPNLNYFVVTGAVALYASIYFRIYPTDSETYEHFRCHSQNVMGFTGYVLCFAPFLAKMWRVYYIFKDPLKQKKTVKDYHLVIAVLLMLFVIVLPVILGVAVPALRPSVIMLPDVERPYGQTEDGVKIVFYNWDCYNSFPALIWLALEIFYIIILHIAAIVLAFKARKVNVKALNESKSLAANIYITSIVLVALVIIVFTLSSYLIASEMLLSGGIILATTFFLASTFVPKMVALYRDPNSVGAMKANNTCSSTDSPEVQQAVTRDVHTDDIIASLKQRIVELEQQSTSNIHSCAA